MTALDSSTVTRVAQRSVRRPGLLCLVGGLLGAAQAATLLVWPEQVSESMFRYPMSRGWFVAAQLSFAAQHLLLLVGIVALLRAEVLHRSPTARVAVRAAGVGMALLAILEVVAISAVDDEAHSSRGDLVTNLYGVPVLLMGTSLVVAGIVAVRRRERWTGAAWLPWLVLALGVYVFVPLSPAIMGSFVAGRLGIGGWMALFAVLGYGLTRLDTATRRSERP
jgi:hypothetical protein